MTVDGSTIRATPASAAPVLRDGVGYFAVSVAALAADGATLIGLTAGAGLHYLAAAATAFLVGLAVAWTLSATLVFRGRRKLSPAREFGGFLLTGLVGLLITQAVMLALVDGLALQPILAKIPAAGLTFAFNFASRRALFFAAPVTASA